MPTFRVRCHQGDKHQRLYHAWRWVTIRAKFGTKAFVKDIARYMGKNALHRVVLNAGILKYPNVRAKAALTTSSDYCREPPKRREPPFPASAYTQNHCSSFHNIEDHMKTNAIGPIIVAQRLLLTDVDIKSLIFMSSDSGSTSDFRDFEDGYDLS